jgi:hypothetical protein
MTLNMILVCLARSFGSWESYIYIYRDRERERERERERANRKSTNPIVFPSLSMTSAYLGFQGFVIQSKII